MPPPPGLIGLNEDGIKIHREVIGIGIEKERDIKERRRDSERERQRDRETERKKDRETKR